MSICPKRETEPQGEGTNVSELPCTEVTWPGFDPGNSWPHRCCSSPCLTADSPGPLVTKLISGFWNESVPSGSALILGRERPESHRPPFQERVFFSLFSGGGREHSSLSLALSPKSLRVHGCQGDQWPREEGLCREGSVEAPCSSRMARASLTAADRPCPISCVTPHSPRVWLVEGAVLLKAAGRFKERASKMRRRKGGLFRDLAGFPGDSDGKESTWNAGNLGSIPGLGRSPGEGKGLPTPVFWRIPWTEEPGRLPSMRSQRGRTRLSD